MKKYLRKVTIALAFAFITIASIGATIHASDNQIRTVGTKMVTKTCLRDENKITGAISNEDVLTRIEVPSDAFIISVDKDLVTEYWNYKRYFVTYGYQSSLGYH